MENKIIIKVAPDTRHMNKKPRERHNKYQSESKLPKPHKKQNYQIIHFYLQTESGDQLYLLKKPFSFGLYEYFEHGRRESEILSFRNWDRNPALDKVITRLPAYIKYALNEAAEAARDYEIIKVTHEDRWLDDREIA